MAKIPSVKLSMRSEGRGGGEGASEDCINKEIRKTRGYEMRFQYTRVIYYINRRTEISFLSPFLFTPHRQIKRSYFTPEPLCSCIWTIHTHRHTSASLKSCTHVHWYLCNILTSVSQDVYILWSGFLTILETCSISNLSFTSNSVGSEIRKWEIRSKIKSKLRIFHRLLNDHRM